MTEPHSAPDPRNGTPRYRRPAPLLFEPTEGEGDPEHFFGLESVADPDELLGRATRMALAFRNAADRAVEYQAIAAARLSDPSRFDRLSEREVAERAEWTEDYARKMIEFGHRLLTEEDTAR